ncbi:MAG: DUF1254 domain-containing protein [Bosea sp. (in: a-proteobacteria)]
MIARAASHLLRAPTSARRGIDALGGLKRFVYLTTLGLVLGAIVHLVAVFLIPRLAERDAANLFSEMGEEGRADLLDATKQPNQAVIDGDPKTAISVCAFNLETGPVRVVAKAGLLPLSLSLHKPGGGVLYAITDRAAVRGTLEFVILTATQLDERLARDDESESVRELRVVSAGEQGIVVARALAKRPSDRAEAEALVKDVACGLAD